MQSSLSRSSTDVKAEPPLREQLWGDQLRKFPVEHHSNRKCWLDETQNIPQECANSIKTFERGQAGLPGQPTSLVSWLALPSPPGSLAAPSGQVPGCYPCPLRGPRIIIKLMESYKVCWETKEFKNENQNYFRIKCGVSSEGIGYVCCKASKVTSLSCVSSFFYKTSSSEKSWINIGTTQ